MRAETLTVVAARQEEERKPQKVHGCSEVQKVGVTEEDAGRRGR